MTRRGLLKSAGLCAAYLPLRKALGAGAEAGSGRRPNIVLIMADDLGYECLGCDGSLDYKTPVLDSLAAEGVRFVNCHAQPLCTPSRVEIMTGRSNARNYEIFGYLNPKEITFANRLRSAGYKTCIAGKWQLSGNAETVRDFGFDEHCLWNLHAYRTDDTGRTTPNPEGWLRRYANPVLYRNGKWMTDGAGKYGPDLCCDFICSFIENNRDKPFLAYYPMILTHPPFTPTPDSKARPGDADKAKSNFTDMVQYMDKLVGRIVARLAKLGLRDNTLVLFTGDNGTAGSIVTRTKTGDVRAGKKFTKDTGTHVPLIASWPNTAAKGRLCEDLVDFSDFLPTICECAGVAVPAEPVIDGRSFLPQVRGEKGKPREWLYAWYSRNGRNGTRWARDKRYKLYASGGFYDVVKDPDEKSPLDEKTLDAQARKARAKLQAALDQYANARPARL